MHAAGAALDLEARRAAVGLAVGRRRQRQHLVRVLPVRRRLQPLPRARVLLRRFDGRVVLPVGVLLALEHLLAAHRRGVELRVVHPAASHLQRRPLALTVAGGHRAKEATTTDGVVAGVALILSERHYCRRHSSW